jgi:hypothetical protein
MSEDSEREIRPEGVLVIRLGHGANCSSMAVSSILSSRAA